MELAHRRQKALAGELETREGLRIACNAVFACKGLPARG